MRRVLVMLVMLALVGGALVLDAPVADAAPPQDWDCVPTGDGTPCPPIPTTGCTQVDPPTQIGVSPDLADGVDDCIYYVGSGNSPTVVIGATYPQACERDGDLKITNPPCTDQPLPFVGGTGTQAPEIGSQPTAPPNEARYTEGSCEVREVVGRWVKSQCLVSRSAGAPAGVLGVVAQRFYPVYKETGFATPRYQYSAYTVGFDQVSGTAPLADFTWTPTATRFQVAFDASISTGSSPPLSYAWAFEGSQSGTGITATHTFGRAGRYSVTLTVTDRYGRSGTKTRTVDVQGPVVVNSTGDEADDDTADGSCDTGGTVATPGGSRVECTLRAALQTVEAGTGNAVQFDIAAGGAAPTIAVASKLPRVTKQVAIDGTTQPTAKMVEVTGGAFDGLELAGDGSVVKGLAISGFSGPGLTVSGSGTKVTGNRFGTDASGTQYRPSGIGVVAAGGDGITIGGSAAADGNQVVTNADGIGIYGLSGPAITTDDLTVRHNTIGMDPSGTTALGPGGGAGIFVLGDGAIRSTISDNVVTATRAAIAVVGAGPAGSTITSNTVGTDRARTARVGAPAFGIRVDAAKDVTIGTNAVVAKGWDISVSGSVQGNFTPSSYQFFPPTLTKTTGPVTGGGEKVVSNQVGVLGDGRLASGSGSEGITVWGGGAGALVQDNTVAGHSSSEIALIRGEGHRVLGNRVGLSPTGDAALGGGAGIVASATPGVQIGTSTADGNQVGGVAQTAILVKALGKDAAGGATVAGNRIGFLGDGSTAAGTPTGIVVSGAPGSTIGPDNVVGNSRREGIVLDPSSIGSTVTGNRIGMDVAGIAPAPNQVGIFVPPGGASVPPKVDITIDGNTVGASTGVGIAASGGGVAVLRNRVGVGPTSLRDLGNDGPGIVVDGDDAEVRGNLVGFNRSGIVAGGKGQVVADNQVGQPAADESDIGNDGDGIVVEGTGKVTGNVVGHNGSNGIDLSSDAKAEVRGNRVASNGEAGIASQSTEGTIIRDNRLGLAPNDAARPNRQGIRIDGGKVLVKGNRIGASTAEAISVASGATATLTSNSITGTGATTPISATAPPAPTAPTTGFAVRKGTGDEARTWLELTGPDAPGTFEAFGNTDCSDQEARVPMATGTWKGGTEPIVLTVRGRSDLMGYTVTFTGADGRTSQLSPCTPVDAAALDGDGDGIPTIVEAASPWSAQATDSRFVALPSDKGGWVGLKTEDGAFQAVTPTDPPAGRPAGLELPFGMVGFELKLPAPGFDAEVQLLTSGVASGASYWKFGSDEGKPAAWYRFDYREKPAAVPGFFERTGARPETFTVGGEPYAGFRITFDDGLRGDADLTKDGVIVDPGGGGVGGVDASTCPAAKGSARYVCRLYQHRLGRAPDAAGGAFWAGRLDRGLPRRSLVSTLSATGEARRATVQQLYSTYLHRAPDPLGLQYWSDKLRTGTSPEAIRAALASSRESFRMAGGTNRDWVAVTYLQVLGRGPTEQELDDVTALADAGASRSSLARSLLATGEGRDRRVAELYGRYLGRVPGASELAYWQVRLDRTISEAGLEAQLLASNEFAGG